MKKITNWIDYHNIIDKELEKTMNIKDTHIYKLQEKNEELKFEVYYLEKRLRHLLQSETIKSFDEYKPFTREYNLDIKKLDEIFSSIFDYTSQDMKLRLLTNCCLEKLIKGIETGNIILEFK